MQYLFVGLGGAIGSLLRYILSGLNVPELVFPIGTLAINLSGAFFLGWFTARLLSPGKINANWAGFFTTGVTGSFTTFSAFCLETVLLLEKGHFLIASFYLLLSLAGGLGLVSLGTSIDKNQAEKAGGRG
ncbi:hypothetical protein AM500_10995 [Bacillus sp. FJAT-18017]|uniref:fluoride efflux transporter CrcB n=1 Tax=Bacillus sp. FJAT-18017 TaxID=1705566 RepID=UPI0006AE5AC9|nr:fluoride efflux transporter CrcB [Bacillus sp. FJAT-18017]ALC90250.1 hypothetical protein AM500_10995 [Bacillus sp. FJAT-18017]